MAQYLILIAAIVVAAWLAALLILGTVLTRPRRRYCRAGAAPSQNAPKRREDFQLVA